MKKRLKNFIILVIFTGIIYSALMNVFFHSFQDDVENKRTLLSKTELTEFVLKDGNKVILENADLLLGAEFYEGIIHYNNGVEVQKEKIQYAYNDVKELNPLSLSGIIWKHVKLYSYFIIFITLALYVGINWKKEQNKKAE